MIFITLNLFIIFSLYVLTVKIRIERLTHKIITVGTLFCAQITLSQILLGCLSLLYPPSLVVFNVLISGIILGLSSPGYKVIRNEIQKDVRDFSQWFIRIFNFENALFLGLLAFVTFWFILAAFLLPPRGVDDLTYHLAPIYEYILNHKTYMLPLEQIPFYSYPLNGEMLFMWPTIFSHNTDYLGLVSFVITVWGLTAVYGLTRRLDVKPSIAFFVSIQFLFAPVVLAQAGSTYIDNMIGIFFLVSLYFGVEYYLNKKPSDLFLAGIAIGLLLGMKYSALLLIIFLQIPLFPILRRIPKKHLILYGLLILIFAGYWYLRNYLLLGNPFAPLNFLKKNFGIIGTAETGGWDIKALLFYIPQLFSSLYRHDLGLGSFHGGMGLTFWGIGFPCWVYAFFQSLIRIKKNPLPVLILMPMLAGWVVLLLIPQDALYLAARYGLFIIAFGLMGMGIVLSVWQEKRPIYRGVIKACCILFAFFSVSLLSLMSLPSYRIDAPIYDMIKKKTTSKNKYLELSGYMPDLCYVWELLDYLTLDKKPGWNCAMATEGAFGWAAPTYGNRLQNRIYNFQKNSTPEPDAFILQGTKDWGFTPLSKKVDFEEIFLDPTNELIFMPIESYLFVKKKLLEDKTLRLRLAKFYYNYLEEGIVILRDLSKIGERDIPFVVHGKVGHAIKYYQITDKISNPVYLSNETMVEKLIQNRGWNKVYTLKPLSNGFDARVIHQKPFKNHLIQIYENTKKTNE